MLLVAEVHDPAEEFTPYPGLRGVAWCECVESRDSEAALRGVRLPVREAVLPLPDRQLLWVSDTSTLPLPWR